MINIELKPKENKVVIDKVTYIKEETKDNCKEDYNKLIKDTISIFTQDFSDPRNKVKINDQYYEIKKSRTYFVFDFFKNWESKTANEIISEFNDAYGKVLKHYESLDLDSFEYEDIILLPDKDFRLMCGKRLDPSDKRNCNFFGYSPHTIYSYIESAYKLFKIKIFPIPKIN
jgi:hypothetical protein